MEGDADSEAWRVLVWIGVAVAMVLLGLWALSPSGPVRRLLPSVGLRTPGAPTPAPRGDPRSTVVMVVDADGHPVEDAVLSAAGARGEEWPAPRPVPPGGRWQVRLPEGTEGWLEARLKAVRGPLVAEACVTGEPGALLMLRLPAKFDFNGRLVGATSGRPLAGRSVLLQGRSAYTEADGSFVLRGLPASWYPGRRIEILVNREVGEPLVVPVAPPKSPDPVDVPVPGE
jgi:hypothetical protein